MNGLGLDETYDEKISMELIASNVAKADKKFGTWIGVVDQRSKFLFQNNEKNPLCEQS